MARDLLAWFERHARDLPWRRDRDPYRAWVAEVLLQQTRVETGIGAWRRFLARFPDVRALAAASESEVLEAWAGLGYYARARNLHRAARRIARAGRMPASAAEWRALPGVGPYIAGAVASLALGEDVPAVDGNAERVLCRLHRAGGGRRAAEALARRHLPPGRAGAFNEALMDLGATVCTPRRPRCGDCPLAAHCAARAAGDPEAWPPPRRRRAAPIRDVRCVLVRDGTGRVLLGRRPPGGLYGGLWELPSDLGDGRGDGPDLAEVLAALCVRLADAAPVARLEHRLTHRLLRVAVLRGVALGSAPAGRGPYVEAAWLRPRGRAVAGWTARALCAAAPDAAG